MALRKMVEPDCCGSNPLVGISSHFVQDRALKDEGFRGSYPVHADDIASASSQQLVQEFFEEMGQSTQTFRMDSLLAEMRDLEGRVGPVRSPPVSQLTREEDVQAWAQQYLEAGKHFEENAGPGIWTTDETLNARGRPEDYLDLGIGPQWASEYLLKTQENPTEEPILADLSNSEEYVDNSDEVREAAGDILAQTADDPRFSHSKFIKFMRQISNNDGGVQDSKSTGSKAEHWSLEFDRQQNPEAPWEEGFLAESSRLASGGQGPASKDDEKKFSDVLWQKLSQQWDRLSSDHSADLWSNEFIDYTATYKDYKFSDDNPMSDHVDPLEEAKKKLAEGDLPSAVLCLEAAVQKDPNNAFAWQLLGTTQAENEQDPQAIAALKKCIQIEPGNLTALMALAVSYTNENFQNQACKALKEWLKRNPKYVDLVTEVEPDPTVGITSLMTRELHESVKEMFLKAARRNPTDSIDPDVQCGLGVLFNLSDETNLAVDCFKAALQARPNDAKMWNRLGATLANGSRSEEAVDAYRSALLLSPGFIRARYNLGITCVHLGASKEAAEHLLTALNQQAAGRGPQGDKLAQMSDSIWNTLRLVVCSMLDRSDLTAALVNRDLEKLNKEFGID